MAGQDSIEDIIQLPVVMKDGQIVLSGPELTRMSYALLTQAAQLLEGTLVWFKYRAVYQPVEDIPFCVHKDCWRPSVETTLRCADH